MNSIEPSVFPGVPDGLNLVLSKQLFEASLKLDAMGNDTSVQLSEVYQSLSLCLLVPSSYFELFRSIGEYYDEMHDYWNNEVFIKNGGRLGSSIKFELEKDDSIIDSSILDELDPEAFNLMMGLVFYTQDQDVIKDYSGDNKEKFSILNRVFWAVYMGLFKREYFEKNYATFVVAGTKAKNELQALMNQS
jgi:hypothetical protein